MTETAPKEVLVHASFMFQSLADLLNKTITPIDPSRVRWFAKSEHSRSAAWDLVRENEPYDAEKNPWRKCHTGNFWVWVQKV